MTSHFLTLALMVSAASYPCAGQISTGSVTPAAASAPTVVPALVPYAGTVEGAGKVPSGETAMTFLLFKDEQGGESLWSESQMVLVDASGHYKVQLGASSSSGLPLNTFASGEGRWLEVQIAGQPPQARVLLMSVPYAMKAADAATLGGLPASAYALAGTVPTVAPAGTGVTPDTTSTVTTVGGAAGYLSEFSGASTIVDSPVFVSGSDVGIGTKTPSSTLEVIGTTTLDTTSLYGPLKMNAAGAATTTLGYSSQQQTFAASSYNSTSKEAVAQTFAWQAAPLYNNESYASGALDLLFGSGTATPAATGLSISSNGVINFAAAQKFPASGGTITGITTTSPLSGSGTSGSVALSLNVPTLETTLNTKYAQLAAANTFTGLLTFASGQKFPGTGTGNGTISGITTTSPLSGSGTSGSVALSLNVPALATTLESTFNSKYAQLAAANTFTGLITFASGQKFPGAGEGTITGITAGTALTGGGTTGAVNLNLNTAEVPLLATANRFTANQSVTGSISASGQLISSVATGTAPLSVVSTTQIPNLNASLLDGLSSNAFVLADGLGGFSEVNLPVTSSAALGVLNIGGAPFLSAYPSGSENVFVGGAGNFKATGSSNVAVGTVALVSLTSGSANVAEGYGALYEGAAASGDTAIGTDALLSTTAGQGDTAVGFESLDNNRTGYYNTALGYFSQVGSGALTNATAIGADAVVSQSNSLVLGETVQGDPGSGYVNVGIGTDTPRSVLEAAVSAKDQLGPVVTLTNSGGGVGAASAVDFNSYSPSPSASGAYNPAARMEALDDNFGDDIVFLSNKQGKSNQGLQINMDILANGNVGIGTTDPGAQLEVLSNADDAFGGIGGNYSGVTGTGAGDGVHGYGGTNGGVSGASGGSGGFFYGGDADTTDDIGYGIYVASGEAPGDQRGISAYFFSAIDVNGTVYSMVSNTKIDHPLDPANKYLVHAAVQSSEMMNMYTGNVTTDELGLATVNLPGWFEAENTDFRYQLTVLGERFAQAVVSRKIANHQFTIHTNASHVEVSWQVTGVRQDAYAKAHPLIVEQEKPAREVGYYKNPELFGQPRQKQTQWGRNPKMMERMEAQHAAMKARQANGGKSAGSLQPQLGPPPAPTQLPKRAASLYPLNLPTNK